MTQKHYNVACVPCPDYTQDACRAALCQALEALDVLAWLRPGMTEGIKANLVAARCLTAKPKLHTGRCTGCGQCARICPARAITLRRGKPVINRSACIRCFCCQEFCPQGAMRIARPLPARILNP